MTRLTIILALVAVGCGGGAQSPEPTPSPEPTIPFHEDGRLTLIQEGQPVVELAIEIAETDSARNRGLMEREALPENSGMLFVFQRPEIQQFYMANTPMSLDFFFIGADSVIVNTVKYAPPLSLESIVSTGPAIWVLEVEAGFIDTYGLVAGDRVTWSRN